MVLCVGVLFGCGTSSERAQTGESPLFAPALFEGMDRKTSFRLKHYLLQGYLLYKQHCAGCHGLQGEGLRALYPPLASTVLSSAEVACVIKYGTVASSDSIFQPVMPVVVLKDIQIAELVTFVQNAWGRRHGLADVKEVQSHLVRCATVP